MTHDAMKAHNFFVGVVCLILVVVAMLYGQLLGHEYLRWDEIPVVVDNENLHSITWPHVRWIFSSLGDGMWMPVTYLSFLIQFALLGNDSGINHLVNPLLHVGNTVMLFSLLSWVLEYHCVKQARTIAAVAAVLCAVHPVAVEATAWMLGRRELLCALFYQLSLWFWLKQYHQTKNIFSARALAWCCAMLALMSNPMAITLPVILVLAEVMLLKQPLKLARVVALWPFFVPALLLVPVALYAEHTVGALPDVAQLPFTLRVAQALDTYVFYMGQLLLPLQLLPYYPSVARVSELPVWRDLLVWAISAWLVMIAVRRHLWLLVFMAVWYLVTFSPACGVVQIGSHRMADRYAYLPVLALYGGFAFVICTAVNSFFWLRPVFLVAVLLLALATFQQIGIWKKERILWETVVQREPDAYLALGNLAGVYMREGYYDQALKLFHRAAEKHPDKKANHQLLIHACEVLQQWRCAYEASVVAARLFPEDPDFAKRVTLYQPKLTP